MDAENAKSHELVHSTVKSASNNDIISKTQSIPPPPGFGYRHIQVLLLFSGLAIGYSLRVNLSVGIVAMTTNDGNKGEVYDWDESTQGIILSSFFWGYFLSQIPASQLAIHYGPKLIYFIAGVCCGLLTIIIPWAASFGWQPLLPVRMALGVFQGFFFPCTHTILAKWVHPSERGRLASITYSGVCAGTVVMLAASGIIAASFMGWPGIFYCSGGLCLLWSAVFYVYGANSPTTCSNITPEEKAFIESMPGANETKFPVPWREIFTSKAMFALIVVHSTQNWGHWTLLTEIPTYMKQVFGFDIKTNALLSALPYLILWILTVLFSPISDYLINHGYMSISIARKTFNSIGHWIPMITLIALAYTTNNTLAVILLAVAVGLNAGTNVGFLVNHIDLSPNFAGTLMAITNSIANVLSILPPLVAGAILNGKTETREDILANWRTVFFISAGFYLIGNLLFVLFGKGKVQSWNEPKPKLNST